MGTVNIKTDTDFVWATDHEKILGSAFEAHKKDMAAKDATIAELEERIKLLDAEAAMRQQAWLQTATEQQGHIMTLIKAIGRLMG